MPNADIEVLQTAALGSTPDRYFLISLFMETSRMTLDLAQLWVKTTIILAQLWIRMTLTLFHL
jgi:hypothetical protein